MLHQLGRHLLAEEGCPTLTMIMRLSPEEQLRVIASLLACYRHCLRILDCQLRQAPSGSPRRRADTEVSSEGPGLDRRLGRPWSLEPPTLRLSLPHPLPCRTAFLKGAWAQISHDERCDHYMPLAICA